MSAGDVDPACGLIGCEVAWATPTVQLHAVLELRDGATVQDALEHARALWRAKGARSAEDIDWDHAAVGIFGHACGRATRLREGDRVEIYRPLQVDPRESRRRRVAEGGRRKGQGGRQR